MKILERWAMLAGTTALLGPANLLLAASLSGLLIGYRLLSRGYYRCFISTK